MVLAVDGQPVSSYNDVEAAIARAAAAAAPAAAGQHQQGAAPPAKRARMSEEDGALAAPTEAAGTGPAAAVPEVQLTVFRDGAVQDVAVRCA